MINLHQTEVDRNYEAFEKLLPTMLPRYRGMHALMKSGKIEAFFETAGDAYTAGVKLYPDHVFSIQEVTDEEIYLGYFSAF
jgi:hypothetical protein